MVGDAKFEVSGVSTHHRVQPRWPAAGYLKPPNLTPPLNFAKMTALHLETFGCRLGEFIHFLRRDFVGATASSDAQ
jgi:hypothetical protein